MDKEKIELTPNKFIKTNTILHLCLLFPIILFGTYIYFENDDWKLNYMDTQEIYFFIIPIVSIYGILFGNFMFKRQIKSLASKSNLKEKLMGFQSASIVKYALIEAPALFGIVAAMETGNLFYLLFPVLLAIYLYSQKPTKNKIEESLELNFELKSQFNKSDQIIE